MAAHPHPNRFKDTAMAAAHDDHLTELNIRLQDGTMLTLHRDEHDRLIATAFAPEGSKYHATYVASGGQLAGFGPWPTWDASRRTGTLTRPDDESGLFEPERLFVLREQYAYLAGEGVTEPAKFASVGPIDRAWWTGTEHVVQARKVSGKH